MADQKDALPPHKQPAETLRCSFCYKPQIDVFRLIVSPVDFPNRVYICEDCVAVCYDLNQDIYRELQKFAIPVAGVAIASPPETEEAPKERRTTPEKTATKPANKAPAKKVKPNAERPVEPSSPPP